MPRSVWIYESFWILLMFGAGYVTPSHFTGGVVSWRTVDYDPATKSSVVSLGFRVAWKASHSSATGCNETDILNQKTLISDVADWKCTTGCSDFVYDGVTNCTEFDLVDDWSLGYGMAQKTLSGDGLFKIEYEGCCWINTLVYGNRPWRLIAEINAGIRSDTRKPNNSPMAAVTPVVRFKAGCPEHIDIVMFDPDGDTVSCRFPSADECERSHCTSYPYFRISQEENKCRVSYNGGGPGNTDVAIPLVIEDYAQETINISTREFNETTRLSSVSMQFLIRLFSDINACYIKPKWVSPTFDNSLKTAVPVNRRLNLSLAVQSDTEIERVTVIGPHFVEKSPIRQNGNIYSTDLTWTPSQEQVGLNVICISAKDIGGRMSEQRCMSAFVGDASSPCSINNGGCSDECVEAADSYICECERDCWILALDRRTCMPDLTVDCENNGFQTALSSCAVGGSSATIGVNYDNLAGASDESEDCEASNNGTHYNAFIRYDQCGTVYDNDFLEIHYRNQIRVWLNDESVGSGASNLTITRGTWYRINMVCSFNRYGNVNASFLPRDQEGRQVLVPGLGSFQFFFDFYLNENFKYTYSPYEYPIEVTVNSDIYFGIRASGAQGLEVFTERCVARTTEVPTDTTISYTMIDNGCTLDSTMRKYNATSEMEERFSIKAFRFQEKLIVDSSVNIYIQCSAVLCVLGEPSTRCQKGCITTRKRRDANNQFYLDHQIRTRKKRETDDDDDNQVFSPNVSESTTLQITVSGPFRIDVIPPSDGIPGQTVVTPTKTNTVEVRVPDDSANSTLVIVIAASVGGVLLMVLILILACCAAYHFLVIVPKRKIKPTFRHSRQRLTEAWQNPSYVNEEMEHPIQYENIPTKPPPSFWDIDPMT